MSSHLTEPGTAQAAFSPQCELQGQRNGEHSLHYSHNQQCFRVGGVYIIKPGSVITQTNLHAFSMGISAGFFIFCLKTLLESANCLCHWEGIAGLFLSKKMLNITPDASDTLALLLKTISTN